jgi:preprotein translocase subunit SecF
MRTGKLSLTLLLLLCFSASPALAYIGPGAGAGTVAVVLGILASIVMAFVALLWYPLKRLMKSRKAAKEVEADETESSSDS